MALLIPDSPLTLKIIKETKKIMDTNEVPVIINNLNNGYFSVTDANTGKILKPTSFKEPNFVKLLNSIINF